MSWSIMVVGKPLAVVAEVDRQISNTHVNLEPELEIQKAIAKLIRTALADYPENSEVRIEANGSQYTPHPTGASREKINQVSLKIEALYGFVQ